MSNPLSENLQYITLGIEDDLDAFVGTGFLVADTPLSFDKRGNAIVDWTTPATRAYLVTARHVLGDNESVIRETINYTLKYNTIGPGGFTVARRTFLIANDPPNWTIHPDTKVDIAVLDVTGWLQESTDGHFRFCPLTELATPMSIAEVDCDAGDDVFVIGYPLKLQQGSSNLPLFRKGVLATSPRRRLVDLDDGLLLRGFLVDGAIMPGSSGSPVITTSRRFIGGDVEITPYRPLIVGVVAQEWGRGELQRYNAAIRGDAAKDIEGYANLGFAHSSAAIIETIVEMGYHEPKDFLRRDGRNWVSQTGIPQWAIEYEGPVPAADTMQRMLLRVRRDRMRDSGTPVRMSNYHDAVDILGPVPASPQNALTDEDLLHVPVEPRAQGAHGTGEGACNGK